MSQKAGSKTYYYHHDGLGSVADATGNTGTSLIWNEYYPYGLLRQSGSGSGAPVNPFNFTGEQLDAVTGFYHMRARQYDPGIGRFITTDPRVAPASDPHVSGYSYVRNDPCGSVDPSGLAGKKQPSEKQPIWEDPEFQRDVNRFLGVALKCSYAFFMVTSELSLAAASGTWAGVTIVTVNPVTGGVTGALAVITGGAALFNLEHTKQATLWCLGGPEPTAPTVPMPP